MDISQGCQGVTGVQSGDHQPMQLNALGQRSDIGCEKVYNNIQRHLLVWQFDTQQLVVSYTNHRW